MFCSRFKRERLLSTNLALLLKSSLLVKNDKKKKKKKPCIILSLPTTLFDHMMS
ncbi:hypothetical protein HanRHA438_Chr08g0351781 [Helianthus annuus]|nr:hypothetical protein HanRHA438_Chr08g0351781 [Helianthus annuus]